MSINVTQQGSRARRVFMIGAVSVLVVLALVGGYFGLRKAGVVDDKITVTAQFDEGSGLFVGNVVEVLGLPVGRSNRSRPRAPTSRSSSTSTRTSRSRRMSSPQPSPARY
ncbi:hypothetical protein E3G58_002518 [Mycobacteroides abscessus]|nr:hypothetical protein [Mycobacteroides abscessus]